MIEINYKINFKKTIFLFSVLFVSSGIAVFLLPGSDMAKRSEDGNAKTSLDHGIEEKNYVMRQDDFAVGNSDRGNSRKTAEKIRIVSDALKNFLGVERKKTLFFLGENVKLLREEDQEVKTIKVPEDFQSIQAAIDSAKDGDTVKVFEGEYTGNISLKEGVNLVGSGAEVTIINGQNLGNVVSAKNGITNRTSFSGFTIKGSGEKLSGMLIENSSPLIHDNVFTENEYNIYIKGNSSPIVQKNILNFAGKNIQIYNFEKQENDSMPVIADNLITDSKTGIEIYQASALIQHNTISFNNHYKDYLGPTYGIYIGKSSAKISGNIISDSGICDFCAGISADEESSNIIISFNNIWNNKNNFVCFGQCSLEENNISEDPMFNNATEGDYKLNEKSPLIGKGESGFDMGIRW